MDELLPSYTLLYSKKKIEKIPNLIIDSITAEITRHSLSTEKCLELYENLDTLKSFPGGTSGEESTYQMQETQET